MENLIKGSMITNGALTLVTKAKNMMKDGSYWYAVAFTDGENLMQLTGGVKLDNMLLGKSYIIGLDFINGKLKIVDFKEAK